ncbi:MAG: hypothetical protein UU16_C0006G0033 [Candidatus Woesebacteria bacterium GW2011_GWA2_40_7]|uniref:TrpR like protein, YerC/YecD n=3 Tax=Candidatus Woeseibacteriota TaxID=1752722 RepID=A0A0G0X7D3_9BACT|nr:MAG: hypothetical protein UT17_C0002G0084 [Candidatus Woesebacteria bacterium GW2011_GWB1_39_10]KKR74079.1 MAG: hypothetical protein UU16_C0006G0033 [Candidatus Woesebacteria bacterium GW2011_GWA2_40_7]KKR92565.1 MAG: hypothetical protein UU42_C0001G0169 [Candidatus Woesebacteria bacterium GW2011_GWA1_41_13b]
MTLISKHPLRGDTLQRTFELFTQTILNIKDKETTKNFIDGFFTPTEKIIFAKRIAIYVMLAKGNNYIDIISLLKVSPPTIARASSHLKYSHELDSVIKKILIKDSAKEAIEELASVFDIPGKGRSLSSVGKSRFERSKRIAKLKSEF